MNNIIYSQKVQALRKEIYSTRFDEIENMGLLGAYLTVSANISTYFPEFSNEQHYKIIQNIQFHRSLSNIDQYFHYLLDDLIIDDPMDIVKKSVELAHIFVTYHTGSYRMFIQYLNKRNIPFCLVTQEEFIKEQGVTVQRLFKEISDDPSKVLEILPAENPRLLFELVSRLRKGVSVVFYIDGNTGSSYKKLSENNNLLKIDFLSHHIYARQGIALLAYLSEVPIAIALSRRDENLKNMIDIRALQPIPVLNKSSRDVFINDTTQKLYQVLQQFLHNNFDQWEGWFYIHKFFELETLSENSNTDFILSYTHENHESITLVIDEFIHLIQHDEENIFLVKKKDYVVMKISKDLFLLLSYFKEPKIIAPKKELIFEGLVVEWSFIEELIKLNYIVPKI